MREILGRRRMTLSSMRNAALTCAARWQWPVLPGTTCVGGRLPTLACSCGAADCVVPGAHPADPVLLAATTDPRMVSWWWSEQPYASLILATGAPVDGGHAPCALSLPAVAGARALAEFDACGVRVGPVAATPTRWTLLVAPYGFEELGELLNAHGAVPSSLRFHSDGGYVALPPGLTGHGQVRWQREPSVEAEHGTPWLPRMETLVDVLVEASAAIPDPGSTLAY
ncbi:bifunctional DNA primase/polymerase [Streptomyces sp. Z26]|uniref:bifunctional DNA primase/polymerase n=1 Tax=Streptomyces sp. Z26 TaxID=2500177 RepID=UPI000EF15CB5|nr:bifunctional DNA primase/polymerase [Streptomyces sp. Z26]RLL67917.1 DNA primase [Streptomyces sp. Z26]